MGMFSFNANSGETPDTLARKRKIAEMMLSQGADTSAIQHPLQGVARIAQALSGNWAASRIDKEEAKGRQGASEGFSKIMASLYPGQAPSQPAANVAQPSPAPMAPGGDTFQKMIQVESGGNPNAVSPKGATGIAQIMPATARDPGFGVPNIFDFAKKQGVQVADNSDATLQALLRNPQVNAGFGEAYFNAQKQRYGGDEKLAAAAYNAGPGAVDKAGGVPNIPETQAYVQKLGLNGGQQPQVQPAAYQQPQPQPAQMQDAAQQMPMQQLMELAQNPYLNETQQQILSGIIKQRMTPADPAQALELQKLQLELQNLQNPKPEKPPADVQEYQYYLDAEKAAGRQPVDFWTFQKGKVPNTTVNNNMGGEKFDEEFAKTDAKALGDVSAVGLAASRNLARIDQMEQVLARSPSGFEGAAKQLAGEWGINTEGLDNLQAAQAIINSMVPEQRPAGSGPMSDRDLELFKASLPRIINQPGGNALIVQTLRALAQYDAEGASIVQRMRKGEIKRGEAFELLQSRENPLAGMGKNKEQQPEGAPTVGAVVDGHRFKGGDPSKQENWEAVQ